MKLINKLKILLGLFWKVPKTPYYSLGRKNSAINLWS